MLLDLWESWTPLDPFLEAGGAYVQLTENFVHGFNEFPTSVKPTYEPFMGQRICSLSQSLNNHLLAVPGCVCPSTPRCIRARRPGKPHPQHSSPSAVHVAVACSAF